MKQASIPYFKTPFFSQLINDYLLEHPDLSSFYNRANRIENYSLQIQEKQQQKLDRELLVSVLKEQNKSISLSDVSSENIDLLSQPNTFTITTGHQLCIFTGPLYVIFKIVSTINLAKKLKEYYPNYHFVPLFWLASEDHDFEEINHVNAFGRNISWTTQQKGAVGAMNLSDFQPVLKELEKLMGESRYAKQLNNIFNKAYSLQNLSQATRCLINDLFNKDGLVILDGNDKRLKTSFVHVMKKDIINQSYYSLLSLQSQKLAKKYHHQAHVREVNFFKLTQDDRLRITSPISQEDIQSQPQCFSPNVLMRPLYQESILPNLAYVGGGSEVAYWMQLKSLFKFENIPFPILGLRNSALLVSSSQQNKMEQLGMSFVDFFKSESEIHKSYVMSHSNSSIDEEVDALSELFEGLKNKFQGPAYEPIINAALQGQKNALNKLSKKLYKVEKQNHQSALIQLSKLKTSFFPNAILQERFDSFITYYTKHGDNFLRILKEELNPLDSNFVVLSL